MASYIERTEIFVWLPMKPANVPLPKSGTVALTVSFFAFSQAGSIVPSQAVPPIGRIVGAVATFIEVKVSPCVGNTGARSSVWSCFVQFVRLNMIPDRTNRIVNNCAVNFFMLFLIFELMLSFWL